MAELQNFNYALIQDKQDDEITSWHKKASEAKAEGKDNGWSKFIILKVIYEAGVTLEEADNEIYLD